MTRAITDVEEIRLEADAELAERAQRNLAPYPNVEVRCATSPQSTDGGFDAIFVNAGATEILASWLDQLRERGRLLLPLTTEASVPGIAGAQLGLGRMLRVEKRLESYAARFISPVGIFHCLGARTMEGEEKLRAAYQRGDWSAVQSLRRDRHDEVPSCWLHEPSCQPVERFL